MTEADDAVIVERRGRAMVVTLNRPAALNALNRDMCLTIHRALIDSVGEADIACLIGTARGRDLTEKLTSSP